MTYKLESYISKISSPITLVISDIKIDFVNGSAAYDHDFDKRYVITDIYSDDGKVCLALQENTMINDVNWCGEQEASCF